MGMRAVTHDFRPNNDNDVEGSEPLMYDFRQHGKKPMRALQSADRDYPKSGRRSSPYSLLSIFSWNQCKTSARWTEAFHISMPTLPLLKSLGSKSDIC
mmetsp:Transcript_21161/g.42581  ORF Transcript_21161/g.42581 Transcript_21161/m.42581 type:complete len:98 (+) Transcript_21161:44-337(+)